MVATATERARSAAAFAPRRELRSYESLDERERSPRAPLYRAVLADWERRPSWSCSHHCRQHSVPIWSCQAWARRNQPARYAAALATSREVRRVRPKWPPRAERYARYLELFETWERTPEISFARFCRAHGVLQPTLYLWVHRTGLADRYRVRNAAATTLAHRALRWLATHPSASLSAAGRAVGASHNLLHRAIEEHPHLRQHVEAIRAQQKSAA
jgi:hypothetical protein